MWHIPMLFRARSESRLAPARRPRSYRPHCKPLEDRCLLSVTLADGGPPVPLVGSPVTWTATASGDGTTLVYQFRVGLAGGPTQVVQDYSPSNNFIWDPMQEGTYNIQVNVKAGYGTTTILDTMSASYASVSRIVGGGAVVSPTANPLVALYSVPPTSASSAYVEFTPAGAPPSWTRTAPQPIVAGTSTNFQVAGMLPNTTYLMRHVLSDGTASAPISFTTGVLPTSLSFPPVTVPQAPGAGTDPTQSTILHLETGATAGHVGLFSTNLAGTVNWYYDDPIPSGLISYGVSTVPGGTVLVLAGNGDAVGDASALREIDLAGDTLRQTTVDAVNAQLTALGQNTIIDFNHDAQRLPNGDTAVIAHDTKTVPLNGKLTNYLGDMVVVLDKNFQVAFTWDAFNYLDTNDLPTNGEGPGDWLHANAIAISPADGNLIISIRSQDVVVKFDYANGTGDGHVIWQLGEGNVGNKIPRFTLTNPDPSHTLWFSHQHDVRYVNDSTITLFDDGNTRRLTDPHADSRGQELVLDEKALTATLVVNADLGDYSLAVGSAQRLPNGSFTFTSGFQMGPNGLFGQSIEVTPDGTKTFVQQTPGILYRSYFMDSLYSPLTNLYDPGFEDPTLGSAWSFVGAAGETPNGSSIGSGNPNAPQGSQVAYLGKTGTISQMVDFASTGVYMISVTAAQSGNNGNTSGQVQVQVDGVTVTTFTPVGTSYTTETTASFDVAAGNHTITFVGVGSGTTLLDQVGITSVAPSGFNDPGAVNLSSAFNRTGIVADGTKFGGGGLDRGSYALSGNLLGAGVTAGGATFDFGPVGAADVVNAAGQVIALPSGHVGSLKLLATGVNGAQANQPFVVTYTDGTKATFVQSISDWAIPQNYPGESTAVATAYRDAANGTQQGGTYDVYEYTFALDPAKSVATLTLPVNNNLEVIAATVVPAATTVVNLSPAFNRTGIVDDGIGFNGGGLDQAGNALSSSLLGSSLTVGGTTFDLGPATATDVVSAAGQVIALPSGHDSSLKLLATGVNGNQLSQTFVVNYTDGTSATFVQSISDWSIAQNYPGETTAVATAYRDTFTGGQTIHPYRIYEYTFALDPTKTVASLGLPSNANLELFAVTVVPASSTRADLSSAFNRTGIVADGSSFAGGLDNDGFALSANQVGNSLTVGGDTFNLGPAGAPDVVGAAGQVIALPSTKASSLKLLATGVNGFQANQPFVVTYTDGTKATFVQSISDWAVPQNYAGETTALTTVGRDTAAGGKQGGTYRVYEYTFALDPTKTVASITLPKNANVEVLGVDVPSSS